MSLPTSFRLFRKGVNTSTKGTVIFDAKAAAAVMADYAQHGADLMLDLEHLSIKRDAPNYNPDAMGWFKLALRNGELWAVDVRYTPEGAQRLESKKQRYISPYFLIEKATKRVVQIINSALTALPATDGPMALVAASRVQTHGLMAFSIVGNPMDLSVLCELLGLPADATLDDIAAAIKALQEGKTPAAGETPPAPVASSEAPPSGEPAAPAATTPKKTTVSIQHTQDVSGAAVIALTQEVQSLKAERLKDKREALIKANANKLTPILEAWARTQPLDTLEAYFKAAAPVDSETEVEAERETTALSRTSKTQEITLSQEEIEVCKKSGVSQESVLAYKKAQKG